MPRVADLLHAVRARTLLAVLLAVMVAAVPLAATAQDLGSARERVADVEGRIADATAAYEATWAEVERISAELDDLDRAAARLGAEVDELEAALIHRARHSFMHGSAATFELLLAAEGPQAAVERAALMARLQELDAAGIEDAVAARARLDTTVALAQAARVELEQRTAELAGLQAELEDELAAAQASLRAQEALAARQRTISRGSQQGVYACPMDRGISHFIDSWGFPRSGGRRHRGTDIMGPMGAPVYAFTSGVIARHGNGRMSGLTLWLHGDDGQHYLYAHLQGYAPRGAVGTRVRPGELIAYNGDTGNARGGAPHIHFEQHPGGGRAINPFPYLSAACF